MASEYDFDAITFGRELRSHRKALGWTARQLALVYSEEIGREDTPVDTSFIYHLEAGETLMDKGRRAILARIVDMPLALAGIGILASRATPLLFSSPRMDITEYEATLQAYTGTWQAGTTYKVAKDIKRRVAALENAALYSGGNRTSVMNLLCEYQVLAADVVSEQDPVAASTLLGKTVIISYQEKQYNLYAHALRQRAQTGISQFELIGDPGVLTQALADFQATDVVQKQVSPFYQGLVNVRKGLVYAYTAKDSGEFKSALKTIDAAGNQIGQVATDPNVAARLDLERWRLNRASAYLYSPQGSPSLALGELDELERTLPTTSPRRSVHRNILFAKAYLGTGNFPMATSYANAALEVTSRFNMDTLSAHLEGVYRALRNSPYGAEEDTAHFGVSLLKAQRPELF
jgi:hypothetical protein